jgi:hypothetical protein
VREPWATLFEGYEDHWLLGPYLDGHEPDWEGIMGDPRLPSLSAGEKILLDVSCSFTGMFQVLDKNHRTRIAVALLDLP